MKKSVVFLSRHDVSPLMVQHLEEMLGPVDITQYKGTTSQFRRNGSRILFEETNGDVTMDLSVDLCTIMVVVLPLALQIELFACQPALMLVPVTQPHILPTFNARGEPEVERVYCALKSIDKLDISYRLFAGTLPPEPDRVARREEIRKASK
jgi:hypothetical protein